MHLPQLVERDDPAEARVDRTLADEIVVRPGLLVVDAVGALEALLAHPEVAHVDHRRIAARPGADHHHAALLAHEHAGGHRLLTRVIEHDRGIAALADDVPDRLAEAARFRRPLLLAIDVIPVRRDSPVRELTPSDPPHRAVLRRALAPLRPCPNRA